MILFLLKKILGAASTGVQDCAANNVYVIPDILAVREGNKWNIVINDGWMGEYRFNDYYIHMMRTSSDPELKEDGITISRRTVAKYRLQMGIPDSRVRAYL